MQFLETIEGRSNEGLTSAVLKFLLVNSSTMRERFVLHLRAQLPPSKVPTFRDGIICQTEVSVSDGDEKGRIDLLVREEAGMVLGVENKFWADFTHEQPKKYWADLVRLAKGDESGCWLVLLAPKERAPEIAERVKSQDLEEKCCTIFWQDLKGDLDEVALRDRKEVAAAALFLKEYVDRQVLDIRIGICKEQLVGDERLYLPNQFHNDFLYRMKTCLQNPGPVRKGQDQNLKWVGFGFETGVPARRPWFGFLKRTANCDVVMGIHTDIPTFTVPTTLDWAQSDDGFPHAAFVKIDYDESVDTTFKWKDRLSKIVAPLGEAIIAWTKKHPDSGTGPTDAST